MTENDELLLRQYMKSQRQEISDNGFSKRVLQHLPDRIFRISRIWSAFCLIACVVVITLTFHADTLKTELFRLITLIGSFSSKGMEIFLMDHLKNAILGWVIIAAGITGFAYKELK